MSGRTPRTRPEEEGEPQQVLSLFVVAPDSADARRAMEEYFQELARRIPAGFDVGAARHAAVSALTAPRGVFVVGRQAGAVVACGGVQWLDAVRGEIKRMWVHPSARGRGVGRRLLERLEREIASAGRVVSVLDTNRALTEAVAMYRRAGYVEASRYNDNADADLWFEKRLAAVAGSPPG